MNYLYCTMTAMLLLINTMIAAQTKCLPITETNLLPHLVGVSYNESNTTVVSRNFQVNSARIVTSGIDIVQLNERGEITNRKQIKNCTTLTKNVLSRNDTMVIATNEIVDREFRDLVLYRYKSSELLLLDSIRVEVPDTVELLTSFIFDIKGAYFVVGRLRGRTRNFQAGSIHVISKENGELIDWVVTNRLEFRTDYLDATASDEYLYLYEAFHNGISPRNGRDIIVAKYNATTLEEETISMKHVSLSQDINLAALPSGELIFNANHDIFYTIDRLYQYPHYKYLQKVDRNITTYSWLTPLPYRYYDGRHYRVSDVLVGTDGDYYVYGSAFDRRDQGGYNTNHHGWITRITPDGQAKWTRVYSLPFPLGVNASHFRRRFSIESLQERDGKLVAFGTAVWPDENGRQHSQIWTFAVDKNGCLPSGAPCEEWINLTEPERTPSYMFSYDYQWNEFRESTTGNQMYRYRMAKIDSKKEALERYYNVERSPSESGENFESTSFYLRENYRKVMMLRPGWHPVTHEERDDIVLYDWAMPAGGVLRYPDYPGYNAADSTFLYVTAVDSIILATGETRTRQAISRTPDPADVFDYWVEGVGSTKYGMLGAYTIVYGGDTAATNYLTCYSLYGETLLNSTDPERGCWITDTTVPNRRHQVTPIVTVYPNPSAGRVTIQTDFADYRTTIYDTAGRILGKYGAVRQLDLSTFPAGIYTLRIARLDGRTALHRVIIR